MLAERCKLCVMKIDEGAQDFLEIVSRRPQPASARTWQQQNNVMQSNSLDDDQPTSSGLVKPATILTRST
jgi:hypothetical protein